MWAAWWADGRPGAMTPETYGRAMLDWVEQQAHSGPEPKEKYAEYTRLNAARARRVAKTYRMSEDMATILDSGRTEDNTGWSSPRVGAGMPCSACRSSECGQSGRKSLSR